DRDIHDMCTTAIATIMKFTSMLNIQLMGQ
ncbi:hypothetical protein A2U01_0079393, partial [Trifolium medium]|nr:hypothetical protein [Trifolium medium]